MTLDVGPKLRVSWVWSMHAQAVRRTYARAGDGNYLLKSDPGFWRAAEDALVARVRVAAGASGASLTEQQIRSASAWYCWTIHLMESVALCLGIHRSRAGVFVSRSQQGH